MKRQQNKFIALFMGGLLKGQTRVRLNENEIWLPIHGTVRFDTIESGTGKILKYHKDWNWLIEVIRKIASTQEFQNFYEFKKLFWDEYNSLDIDRIYVQVVLFIEWYNENK